MNDIWNPSIDQGTGTIHERLVDAVRRDIASGALTPDDRLPTHRELASRLGIGVGTVTRAYREAERLGLLTSTVGRGTFVAPASLAGPADESGAPIDLTLNIQALEAAPPLIAGVLGRLQHRADIAQSLTAVPVPGIDWQRQVLAEWFRHATGHDRLDWEHTLITTGAQHAMHLALSASCRPGDVLLVEASTFSGVRALAEILGLRCVGVPIDQDGLNPDALEAAIEETGARALYTMPTLQNPTTITMPDARRAAIAEVVLRHDLTVIEDDVYTPNAYALESKRARQRPLAQYAPGNTWYISSLSKAVAMGMRVGILEAPDTERFEAACRVLRATCYAASSISTLLGCQLIQDGVADQICRMAAQEATSRMTLAQRLLGDAIAEPSYRSSLQVWLPMPEVQAERVANGALRRGVILTPPSSFIVEPVTGSGLRICLNTLNRATTERALRLVRSALADELMPSRHAIV